MREVTDYISEGLQEKLETLAGVQVDDYQLTERGIKFEFQNSLQANQCQIIEYHNNVIIELRKKTDNLLEGKMDQLVFEDVIHLSEIQNVFEDRTGIYLSYLDV